MARILTGIQSSNIPHLGNLLGAIVPAIGLSKDAANSSIYFIADLHSLTSIKDAEFIRESRYAVAATWLAFGLDTDKHILFRQSDVPEVCELTWYLSCFMSYQRLQLAHSFKDKSAAGADVNTGLFTYPVLMAADILMYDTNFVPVGKDQKQHVEFTRDLAEKINHHYQKELFVVPHEKIDESVMIIPGIDGRKMSKSYGNFINIFLPEKELKKVIMSVVTDSTPMEAPKNPDTDNVFALYKVIAGADSGETASLREKYLAGGFGYGHAKTALFELIMNKYSAEREAYNRFMNDRALLESELKKGADKARVIGTPVLQRVRATMGF
ncbi:MAG TPA: tryptophan--tRNA ligase [Bacteroidia bacterium]|nr:tryptophan--tRNA ligase [Bacteroidia bacterium]